MKEIHPWRLEDVPKICFSKPLKDHLQNMGSSSPQQQHIFGLNHKCKPLKFNSNVCPWKQTKWLDPSGFLQGATLIAGCSTSQGDSAIPWPGRFSPSKTPRKFHKGNFWKVTCYVWRVEGEKIHHHVPCDFWWHAWGYEQSHQGARKKAATSCPRELVFPCFWWQIAEQNEKSCGWVKGSFARLLVIFPG